jgi:selenocysteine-specific elongation factor
MRLRALLGADEVDGRLRLLDRDVLGPGEAGFAQLRLAAPVAAPAGEHVVLRLASPARTVAGGRILEPVAGRRPRGHAEVLERLAELRDLPPGAMLAAQVARAGAAGATLRSLSQLAALAPARTAELLQAEGVTVARSGLVIAQPELDRLMAQIPPLLAKAGAGLTREQLLAKLPGAGAAALDEAVGRLTARGVVAGRGGLFVVPRPAEDRARATSEAQLASRIAEALRQGGLAPPDPAVLVTGLAAKRAVDRLLRDGVVVRALDRAKGREILFHRDAVAEAQRRLAPLLDQDGGLLVTEAGAALGISRKYSMPLLDHLDTIRFTRRVQERRVRGPAFPPADDAAAP